MKVLDVLLFGENVFLNFNTFLNIFLIISNALHGKSIFLYIGSSDNFLLVKFLNLAQLTIYVPPKVCDTFYS